MSLGRCIKTKYSPPYSQKMVSQRWLHGDWLWSQLCNSPKGYPIAWIAINRQYPRQWFDARGREELAVQSLLDATSHAVRLIVVVARKMPGERESGEM